MAAVVIDKIDHGSELAVCVIVRCSGIFIVPFRSVLYVIAASGAKNVIVELECCVLHRLRCTLIFEWNHFNSRSSYLVASELFLFLFFSPPVLASGDLQQCC